MHTLANNGEPKRELRQITFLEGADLDVAETALQKKSRRSSSWHAKELLQACLNEMLEPLANQ